MCPASPRLTSSAPQRCAQCAARSREIHGSCVLATTMAGNSSGPAGRNWPHRNARDIRPGDEQDPGDAVGVIACGLRRGQGAERVRDDENGTDRPSNFATYAARPVRQMRVVPVPLIDTHAASKAVLQPGLPMCWPARFEARYDESGRHGIRPWCDFRCEPRPADGDFIQSPGPRRRQTIGNRSRASHRCNSFDVHWLRLASGIVRRPVLMHGRWRS